MASDRYGGAPVDGNQTQVFLPQRSSLLLIIENVLNMGSLPSQ